ncbi:MAG: M20/M25/M40 family metallo-hydrolase [Candidatus Bathyarchaeia archaeon]
MVADKKLKNAIDKYFNARETKDFVVEAIKTPHTNTKYWEREPNIHYYIQKFLQPLFDEVGINTWIDDQGNLIARMGKGKSGKRTLIIQHAMAWGAAEDEDEYAHLSPIHEPGEVLDAENLNIDGFNPKEFGVEGEVVWGRDASETIPSTIAALEAARTLARAGIEIPGEVVFIVTSGGHQGSSDNIFHLIFNDEIKADMAVHAACMAAGQQLTIGVGSLGRVDIKVTVYGRLGHTSDYKQEKAMNAIEGAFTALQRLRKIMPFPPGPVDPDFGVGPKLTPIAIESYPKPPTFKWGLGSGGHTNQDVVRIVFDRRILPGESVDNAVKQMEDAIGDISPFKYKLERGAYHFPWKVPKDAPVVKILSDGVRVMLGKEPRLSYSTAAWDHGSVNKLGIPCVKFGAGGPICSDPPIGPHTKHEFAVLNWIYDVSKVYAYFAVKSTS